MPLQKNSKTRTLETDGNSAPVQIVETIGYIPDSGSQIY